MVLIPLLLLGIGVAFWSRRMHSISSLCVASLFVLLANLAWGQERTKETFPDVAGRMVKAINAADYEGLRKDFNKQMLESFPVETCNTFFSKEISGKFGKINKLEAPEFKSDTEAVFVARCERGTLDFTLTLDDQGRVAGMLFRPNESAKEKFADVAGRMVKAINAADYEGLRKDFNKQMLEAFPVEKCKTFFSKEISGKFGKITKLEAPEFKSGTEAVFVARCERGTLDFALTLDDQGRVAGMLFRPGSVGTPVIDDIVKKINAGKDDELFGQCTTEFQKAIPKKDFRATMQQVRKQYGKLNKSTEQKPAGDAKVYRVQGEKGACILKITLDKRGKIAGLEITPDMASTKKDANDGPNYAGVRRSDGSSGAWLADLIADLRKEHKLVGLAAMVKIDGQVMAIAADGERKQGSGVSIELGDRWHLGSITKSITATMIARLIESGKLKWTDTIGERFPDASIHDDWKSVTLQQLLTHSSGAPANFSLWLNLKQPALGPECTQERRKAVMDVIAEKPAQAPGEKFAYSNVGYTIAAAMAESVTGVSWEDLVKREVFDTLELTSAGYGPPKSTPQTLDQPYGHRVMFGGKVSTGDREDNTPIIGPAGAVHMTLGNLCKYATEHLRGDLGAGKLLSTESYKRLHTPKLEDYACGWVVKQPTSEIPHTVYWHNGSNTMWYALVVFIPETKMVVAVTSNDGDIKQAEPAAWKIVKACANQFNVENESTRSKSQKP